MRDGPCLDSHTEVTMNNAEREKPAKESHSASGILKQVITVIPACNQEPVIGSIVLNACSIVQKVIVVDDGSTDQTADVARYAGADVIRLENKQGKSHAILTGLKHAQDFGCLAVVVIDGNARYNIREIPWLVLPIANGNADLVIGSLYLDRNGNMPIRQRLKQKIYSPLDQTNTSPVLTDPLSGFFAVSCKTLHDVQFNPEESDFFLNPISPILAQHPVVREIAVTEQPILHPRIDWDYSYRIVAGLPALNEEKNLPWIINAVKQQVDAVIVIDDGSTDATAVVARQAGAVVVQHDSNLGYGAALQTIFLTARAIQADALVILDSDGQHDPADVEEILEPLLYGAEVVIGSRFLNKKKNHIPQYRKAGMKVLDTATAAAGVKNVTDSQSGYRAYGKKAINALNISGTDMSAGSEILIQLNDHHLKIFEVPIDVRYDLKKTSTHNPISHGISVLGSIIALISYRRPLLAFGIPALILFLIGVGWGIFALRNYEISGIVSIPLSLLSVMFLFFGLLMGITGLILNAMIIIVKERKR